MDMNIHINMNTNTNKTITHMKNHIKSCKTAQTTR